MTDKKTGQSFGFGDQLIVTKSISGAPAGTKAQFLEAVDHATARVKITERKPELAGNDVCYARGARITIPFNRLTADDGSFEAAQKKQEQKTPWHPAYVQPDPSS